MKKNVFLFAFLNVLTMADFSLCLAAEKDSLPDLSLNIYSNIGLVHDTRAVALKKGENEVSFDGVSALLKPETALLSGENIDVTEQSYDYNILNANNIMDAFVGKEVKTLWQSPETGKLVFDRAVLLNANYGAPILKFDYGIETSFPGRVVFENLPQNLQTKPTLQAKVSSSVAATGPLTLTYLTTGISWRADYAAEVVAEDRLNLKTWAYLKNDTGADFDDAKISLVSGNVNFVSQDYGVARPLMLNRAVKAESATMDAVAAAPSFAAVPENVADYHVYVLPNKITLKNKQAKQVRLMEFDNVKFEKEYVFLSPLYLSSGTKNGAFKKQNPNMVYKIKNDKASNLGQALPEGTVRFYENMPQNGTLFIGESRILPKAIGEDLDMTLGKAFDVYAKGKIVNVKQISKDVSEYAVKIKFSNVADKDKKVVYKQNIYGNWDMLDENMQSQKENSSMLSWTFTLPANSEKSLDFSVRISR